MNDDDRYHALASRDRRFDGVFFVGVTTTGIYCRPICRAPLPKRGNCRFLATAAAAERAGFRPCLRCRPELAPGRSLADATSRLAAAAAARIADGALDERGVPALASELCVGERQLRRAVEREYGVPPTALARTQRLLTAKQLLTETPLPVSRVAFASGFGSLSRFNAAFLRHYGLSPSRLRRHARSAEPPGGTIALRLAYRPPLAWRALLTFLAGRATPGVETVSGGAYTRSVQLGGLAGWVSVRPAANGEDALVATVSDSLVPALGGLLPRLRRLFDLGAEPERVDADLAADPLLRPLVEATPGLRVPGCVDGFELAVRAVVGQQVSVAAATTLMGRLVARFGRPLADSPAGLERLPLRPEELADATVDGIAALGFPGKRAAALRALARAVADGRISFEPTADIDGARRRLVELPGVGPWTAEYIAMRAYHWPDAFPATDLALRNALERHGAGDALAAAERWRPWRAYATFHLWHDLSKGSAP